MSRWCALHRPVPETGPSDRAGLPPVVEFSTSEILEACGRLAIAHRALGRHGDAGAARELAEVFALLEQRVGLVGPVTRPRG